MSLVWHFRTAITQQSSEWLDCIQADDIVLFCHEAVYYALRNASQLNENSFICDASLRVRCANVEAELTTHLLDKKAINQKLSTASKVITR